MRFYLYVCLLCMSFNSSYALTKESAHSRCEGAITLIEHAPLDVQDPSIKTAIDAILKRMKEKSADLKKTKNIEEIYIKRSVCDQGFKAIQFLIEQFSTTDTSFLKPSNTGVQAQANVQAPPKETIPTPTEPAAESKAPQPPSTTATPAAAPSQAHPVSAPSTKA